MKTETKNSFWASFWLVYIFFIVFTIPKLLGSGYIYSILIQTRSIGENYQFYGFTVFEIPVIFFGLITYRKSKSVRFFPLFSYILIQNLVRVLLNLSNPIEMESFEMFLSLLTSFSACIIVCYYFKNTNAIEKIFDGIILLNFLTQLMYIVIGRVGNDGRVACLGQDAGSMGLFCVSYILLNIFCRKNLPFYKFLLFTTSAFISLILSGSRTHLIILGVFVAVFFPSHISKRFNDINKRYLIYAFSLSSIFAAVVLAINSDISNIAILTKLKNLFAGNIIDNFLEDASFAERILSLKVALEILKQNPMGLSNSFLDLQINMFSRGSTTFPHSYLLSYFLLWGFPSLLSFSFFIKKLIISIQKSRAITPLILYFIVIYVINGGPLLLTKVYFWHFLIASYVKLYINENVKQNIS